MKDPDDHAPHRWRRRIRRVLRWGLGIALLVLLALLGVVPLVIYTHTGTVWALRAGLSVYSGMIPGNVTIEAIDGTLAHGLTLHTLHIEDRYGQALVQARRIELALDPGKALHGMIDPGTIRVDALRVWVLDDADGGFGDLGPQGPPSPTPPSDNYGPDLPFELQGRLVVDDALIFGGVRGKTTEWIVVPELALSMRAGGLLAHATLQGRASLPQADLHVGWLSLSVDWHDPGATLAFLDLESNAGTVTIDGVDVDLDTRGLEIDRLVVNADAQWLADRFDFVAAGDPQVQLSGAGTTESFSVDLLAELPDVGLLTSTLAGAIEPRPDAQLWAGLSLRQDAAMGGSPLPALDIEAFAQGSGTASDGGSAELEANCDGCVDDLGALSVVAKGSVGADASWGIAHANVRASDATIDVDAAMLPDQNAALQGRILVPRLSALAPIVARLAPDLDLRGDLTAVLACAGAPAASRGVCRVEVDLAEGRPVRAARIEGSAVVASLADIAVELRALMVQAQGATVTLQGGPARIALSPEAVAVRGLDVRVASSTGRGAIAVDGAWHMADPARVDVTARVENLALATANAFVPGLGARGTLHASVDAHGPLTALELEVSASGRGLAAKGVTLGDLRVSGSYDHDRAKVTARVADGELGEIDLDADLPLTVDPKTGTPRLLARGRARASLRMRHERLAMLERFVPALASLDGSATVQADLRRTLGRPQLELDLNLAHAHFQSNRLPDLDLHATYDAGLVAAQVDATHTTAFDTLRIQAEVPVLVDPARGRFVWHQASPHTVNLALANGRLEEIRRWVPTVELEGSLDLRAALRGTMADPKLEAELAAKGVRYQAREVGQTALLATYGAHQADLKLQASGPDVSGLGVLASVPVSLSLARGSAVWHPEREHRLDVSVNELMLDRALTWVGVDTVAGRLTAHLEVTGPASAPVIALQGDVNDAAYGDRPIGTLGLDAKYVEDRATAEASWNADTRQAARAQVDVPVHLDLPHGVAQWRRDEVHHVRIEAPRIDRTMLAPFVDLGEVDATLALAVVGDGHLEDFELGASIAGTVRTNGESHRVVARVQSTPWAQSLTARVGPEKRSWARVDVHTQGAVGELIAGADWRTTPIEATANIEALELAMFSGFVPADLQRLSGRLSTRTVVGGTLGEPKIDGEVHVLAGSVTIVSARQRITDLMLDAAFDNQGLDLTALRFVSSGGHVSAKGSVALAPSAGARGEIKVDVVEVPLWRPGLPRMLVSGQVATDVTVGADTLRVNVHVAKTRVDVLASSIAAGAPIPTNDHVVYVDFGAPADAASPPAEPIDAPAARTFALNINLDDAIAIVGPSVDMRWSGSVAAQSKPDGVAASGAFQSESGTFDLLGNEFQIERGSVTLADDGSGVPFVDVVARTTVDEMQITATVRGPLPRPELVLSSSPAQTESEIFTVLVTGSTDTQNTDPDDVEAKAASVLAALSSPALQRQINDKLHVDKVGIGFGESTDQPILTVGKNITKKITAETEYHHNAPRNQNRAQLGVEYRFAPRWSLETFFGDAAAGGIDLFWGRAFDTDRNLRSAPAKPTSPPAGPQDPPPPS